jgi:hypothetical protein
MSAASSLVLYALAAPLQQVGQTTSPDGRDDARADRAAVDAAVWIGSVSEDQTLAVSPTDRDWWVMDVCAGAAVVVELFPVGTGAVEAVLLSPALEPLAHAQAVGSALRISWISAFDGRVVVTVGPAPDSASPGARYRLRAWWVDALMCPVRAGVPAVSVSPRGAPATVAAPLPPPTPAPPVAARAQTPVPSAATQPPQPRPLVPASAPWGPLPVPELPPGVQEHDGVLWRLALGLGYAGWQERYYNWNYDGGGSDSRWINLAGGGLNMAFGGSLDETLYMYGEFNLNFPQVFGLGVGFGGYFEDNWFVDATIGYHVPTAGYLALTVGKEWWVGEQWLTGLSLRWMGGTGSVMLSDDWVTSVILSWSLTCN